MFWLRCIAWASLLLRRVASVSDSRLSRSEYTYADGFYAVIDTFDDSNPTRPCIYPDMMCSLPKNRLKGEQFSVVKNINNDAKNVIVNRCRKTKLEDRRSNNSNYDLKSQHNPLYIDDYKRLCPQSLPDSYPARVALTPVGGMPKEPKVAVCVRPSYGMLLSAATTPWREGWMRYYQSLGVSHVYFYRCVTSDGMHWSESFQRTNKLQFSEIIIKSLEVCNSQYYGQHWAMNECPYRALSEGYDWVLGVDIDEFLTFREPAMTIPNYVSTLSRSNKTVATFGSMKLEPPGWKQDKLGYCPGGRSDCAKIDVHHPECMLEQFSAPKPSQLMSMCGIGEPAECIGHRGHRKHLSYVPATLFLNIHEVWFPDRGMDIAVLNERADQDVWLRHYYNSSRIQMYRCKTSKHETFDRVVSDST